MKWTLAVFNATMRRRPDYRAKLLRLGTLTSTHFEIDDSHLDTIRTPPEAVPREAVPSQPCPESQNVPHGTIALTELREPTLAEMTANFAGAMGDWARAGFPLAPIEVAKERRDTCELCEFWDGAARMGLGKCNSAKCGCTRLKFFLATSRCPEGKWKR